jgi:glucose/arabinose dehydrogenase
VRGAQRDIAPHGMHRWAGPQIVTLAARMLRRIALIALLFAPLAPAAAAAQTQPTQPQQQPTQPQQQPSQPFSPLPPPQPAPAPTPEPEDEGFLDSEISGTSTLYVIAGALLIAFIAIGMFISRDARKALPAGHRPDAHRLRDEGPHKHKREAKSRARAKGKAQKAARRRNR